MHINIRTSNDLFNLSRTKLEQEANIILYGKPNVLEEAMEREIFRALYIPRNLNKQLIYREPKVWAGVSRYDGRRTETRCVECNRPRHWGSAARCNFCYLLAVRMKFYNAQQGAIWLDGQSSGGWENGNRVGVTMPVTEWWDDSDIPAYCYIASAQWNGDKLKY